MTILVHEGKEENLDQTWFFYFPPLYTYAHTAPTCVFFCVGKQTRIYACDKCKQSALISLPYEISAIKYIARSEEWHPLKH